MATVEVERALSESEALRTAHQKCQFDLPWGATSAEIQEAAERAADAAAKMAEEVMVAKKIQTRFRLRVEFYMYPGILLASCVKEIDTTAADSTLSKDSPATAPKPESTETQPNPKPKLDENEARSVLHAALEAAGHSLSDALTKRGVDCKFDIQGTLYDESGAVLGSDTYNVCAGSVPD